MSVVIEENSDRVLHTGMREELSVMAHDIGSPAQVEAVQRHFPARRG